MSRPDTRVPGHGLLEVGRAFDRIDGQLVFTGNPIGLGVCECGETSAVLTSTNGRRSWHRRIHKPAMRARQQSDLDVSGARVP